MKVETPSQMISKEDCTYLIHLVTLKTILGQAKEELQAFEKLTGGLFGFEVLVGDLERAIAALSADSEDLVSGTLRDE